ncbi:MAG TPA: HD domain-containing phosphohydrolase [Candidatus Udaeobacter sp.]|jgi:HD-GYP domain-containing protein (c-di-GMP phosphodiesterase class II)|nr:HD domain-containing phosphohydrolase [Candidatus Udaeobacter sp.]
MSDDASGPGGVPPDPASPDGGAGGRDASAGGSGRPRDARRREEGQLLLVRLLTALRVGRAYRTGNQTFRSQVDLLMEVLAPILEEDGEVVLVAMEADLYLNGVRLPMTRRSLRHHENVMKEFKRRKIAGLRGERGLTGDELEKFFSLLLDPEVYNSTGLLEGALAQGCDHVQPAIYASTDAPSGEDLAFMPGEVAPEPGAWTPRPSDAGGETFGGGATAQAGAAPRGAAPKNYHLAMAGARSLLTTTSLQDGMEMRHAKRVVQPLVDGAFASEPVVMGLSTLGHHDEYTYMHAVNVCMVAVTMGHVLGLDRRALADLGVAALLHDVGKNSVGRFVHHPVDQWSAEERAAAERHTIEGAKLLARSTALNESTLRCIEVALEHHAGPGGYPDLHGRKPGVLSRIVACADCYTSMQTHRSERGRNVTPYEALGMVLGPLGSRFDPVLRWALVRALGIYPPGQLVRLDDGTIGLVLAPNPDDLSRPHLRVLREPFSHDAEEKPQRELRPIPRERIVVATLKAHDYEEGSPSNQAA